VKILLKRPFFLRRVTERPERVMDVFVFESSGKTITPEEQLTAIDVLLSLRPTFRRRP
jgi:hypothetical protein